MGYNVLVAEDERALRNIVSCYLTQKGFKVDAVANGDEAEIAIDKKTYDIIILDIMMPGQDGLQVCRKIRKKYDVPVIFLTALNQEYDIVNGYEVGADEYITKPVSMPVLEAKINALIKRYCGLVVQNGVIRAGALKIELARRLVTVDDRVVTLAPKEYDLLICFLENKNQVLSRDQILDYVWGEEYDGYDRAVDTHVKNLRAALGTCKNNIKTVIKTGYMWEE